MKLWPVVVMTLIAANLAGLAAFGEATTAPTSRPAEVAADRELAEHLSKLDADYAARKAEILRRYVSQMVAAKDEAIRTRDVEGAQRIFDTIVDTNAKIAALVPPPALAAKPAVTFSVRIADFDGAGGYTNVVKVTTTDV